MNNPNPNFKLIVMRDDETWFWVWNDLNKQWEAFYEIGEEPAQRLRFSDRPTTEDVLAHMLEITRG